MKTMLGTVGACLLMVAGGASAQAQSAGSGYKPTVDDWVGVNAAVDNYTLGLERHDMARFDKAFWPEGTVVAQPEPGMSFTMPYKKAAEGPPPPPAGGMPGGGMPPGGMPPPGSMPPGAMPPGGGPPPGFKPGGGAPGTNAIGNNNPPWHLALNHHFEFQSPTRATHYGYFVSVYPDLKTKMTVVGLPGHYDDILEKRNGEWRILQRTTVIGAK
jgi:hypothetical protein